MTSTSTTSQLVVTHDGPVMVITFARADVMNAMTAEMAAGYAAALRAADADPEVCAVVVTGAGRAFCAGADLAVISQGPAAIREFVPTRNDLPTVAFRIRKPVICAVNGAVAGVGMAYMMASDIRFVAAEAKISTSFARLGLVAEYGLSWILPRVIGAGWTLDLLLTARTITGEEAGRIGLAQYVSPSESVLADALAYAHSVATTSAPASMAAAKKQVYADLDDSHDDALVHTLAMMDHSFDSPDVADALDAYPSRRAPVFQPLPSLD